MLAYYETTPGGEIRVKNVENEWIWAFGSHKHICRARDLGCTGRARHVNWVSQAGQAHGIIFEAQIATKILKIVSERLSEGAQSSECDLIAAGAWSTVHIRLVWVSFNSWFFSVWDMLLKFPKKFQTKNRAYRVLWCGFAVAAHAVITLSAVYRAF